MYQYQPKDFIFHGKQHLEINNEIASYRQTSDYSCYLDKIYPLFSSKKTAEALVSKGLNKSNIPLSAHEIMNLFHLSQERFTRPINAVENEIFQAMAAIGYSYGKKIFCFPWFSQKRYAHYRVHLESLLETLEELDVMVIFPSRK